MKSGFIKMTQFGEISRCRVKKGHFWSTKGLFGSKKGFLVIFWVIFWGNFLGQFFGSFFDIFVTFFQNHRINFKLHPGITNLTPFEQNRAANVFQDNMVLQIGNIRELDFTNNAPHRAF